MYHAPRALFCVVSVSDWCSSMQFVQKVHMLPGSRTTFVPLNKFFIHGVERHKTRGPGVKEEDEGRKDKINIIKNRNSETTILHVHRSRLQKEMYPNYATIYWVRTCRVPTLGTDCAVRSRHYRIIYYGSPYFELYGRFK